MIRFWSLIVLFLFQLSGALYGQEDPFEILIQPADINVPGGLQSFAFGTYQGKWLIIGGRLDGLHRRQPFASFDEAGHNTRLWVIDPANGQFWTSDTGLLPAGIRHQLSSTNMQFMQMGNRLYLAGGYGLNTETGEHTTYENLTAIDIPLVITSIQQGKLSFSGFRQITDPYFAVTGGQWESIGNIHYLVGGQQFYGRYNPMGADHGPGFTQIYADGFKKFKIDDNGKELKFTRLDGVNDSLSFHRRDFNVVSQIFSDGREGITSFSGVFQYDYDIPYLNAVNISDKSYALADQFAQYYNHYHCPTLPIYAAQKNEMHTLFFGGIAQYYDSLGILTQNNNVPFVRTIARITRDKSGKMTEYKLPVEMPDLMGAGAEFILAEGIPTYPNGVIRLDELKADTTLAGYIFGGIHSSAPNIFWVNEGEHSSAARVILEVFIIKNSHTRSDVVNKQSNSTLRLQAYPSPFAAPESFQVKFHLDAPEMVSIRVQNAAGKTINKIKLKDLGAGDHFFEQPIPNPEDGGTFYITVAIKKERAYQKIVIEP